MNRPLRDALRKLLNSRTEDIPSSQFTPAQTKALDEFRTRTGAIATQRKGRGVTYRIMDRTVLLQHSREASPLRPDAINSRVPNRAANIGRSRSSKHGAHRHDAYYLLLRAPHPCPWRSDSGKEIDLGRLTEQQGAGVITVGGNSDQSWHTDADLWLVENQALFNQLDWLPNPERATVACYSGHLRTTLIDWLAARPRARRLFLFPDYDGVGLQNYLRITQRIGRDVQFWLMPDFAERLERFGNNALWQATAAEFHSAVAALQPQLSENPGMRELVQRMQALGRALEQEAIWL